MYIFSMQKQIVAFKNGIITYCEQLNTGTTYVVRKGKEKGIFRTFSHVPRKIQSMLTEMDEKESKLNTLFKENLDK